MNILLLCDEYPPGKHGGIGTAVQLQAKALVQMGHTVVVAGIYDWGYGGKDFFHDDGVAVYRFRKRWDNPLLAPPRGLPRRGIYWLARHSGLLERDTIASLKRYGQFLKGLADQYRIDLVEVPDYMDYLRFVKRYVPLPMPPVPYIVKLHGSMTYFAKEGAYDLPAYISKAEQALLKAAGGVIAVSQYVASRTMNYLPYKSETAVIYNGIEPPDVSAAPLPERKDVVYTGSLQPKKGLHQLLEAWNSIWKKHPGLKLNIYGRGQKRKFEKALNAEARNSVIFHGPVDREVLFKALAVARCAVFPSFAESFGLAPLEAMACGAPTVFTNLTSGPEIITNETDGLLINPANTDEIAAAILRVVEDDRLCDRLVAAAKITVQTRFSIPHLMQQHILFYTKILSRKVNA